MADLITVTFDPKEFCYIRLDHYIELNDKANKYERLMEMLEEHQKEKGEKTKWI